MESPPTRCTRCLGCAVPQGVAMVRLAVQMYVEEDRHPWQHRAEPLLNHRDLILATGPRVGQEEVVADAAREGELRPSACAHEHQVLLLPAPPPQHVSDKADVGEHQRDQESHKHDALVHGELHDPMGLCITILA
jgi:hypothetical protein